MEAKEKAKELIEYYSSLTGFSQKSLNAWMLKEMALHNIQEKINLLEDEMIGVDYNYRKIFIDELEEVKEEINNLTI